MCVFCQVVVLLQRAWGVSRQGMAPLVRTVPGKTRWERVRDRPTFEVGVGVCVSVL